MATPHDIANLPIGPDTRVSKLIRADERAIEVLAELSPKFKKLRNPLLRKVMAPRVTLAEAAKIGGIPFERMAEALEELGFDREKREDPEATFYPQPNPKGDPDLIADLSEEKVHPLDVRSELADGKDPFPSIMKALEQVPPEGALKLINSFEPIPLIRKLERKGYGHYVEEKGKELVITYFRKKGDEGTTEITKKRSKGEQVESDPDRMREEYGEQAAFIDVRGLEMPEPMMRILEHLRQMPSGEGLYVQHERVPRYLLPELEQEGFSYAMKEVADEEDVRLFIFRNYEGARE